MDNLRWVTACRHHFETSTSLSRLEVIEVAKQHCYHECPDGKRYTVHELGLDRDHLHMPEFNLKYEAAHHR